MNGDLFDDTFAAVLRFNCGTGPCDHAVVAASPYGKSFARTDSGMPQHAWLAGLYGVGGPYVTQDEHVFFSRDYDDTGSLDLASDTFTVRAQKAVMGTNDATRPLELISLRTSTLADGSVLVRPQGTQLVTLAADTGFTDSNSYNASLRSTPRPTVIAVPKQSGSTYSLSTFDPATSTLTPIAGLDGFDQLYSIVAANTLGLYFPEIPYCARKAGAVSYVGVRSNGVTTGALPFSDCYVVAAKENNQSSSTLYLVGSNASGFALAFVRNGTVTPVYTNEAGTFYVDIYGTTLQLVTNTTYNTKAVKAWVVTATGSVVPLPVALTNVAVSVHGNTIHVVGMKDSGNGITGSVELIRYREATGAQQITLTTGFALTTQPQVVTTAEGGAIASDTARAWAVTSGSMSMTQLNLNSARGGVRGAVTMLISQQDNSHPTSQPAVYAYDEPNGTPRLTQLTTEAQNRYATLLDPHNGTSEWFIHQPDGTSVCSLSRIALINNVPAMQNAVCRHQAMQIRGRRANGDFIAVDDSVHVLTATTATEVARFSPTYSHRLIYDYGTVPPTVVGWIGKDSIGRYACLAAQPDRCWTIPDAPEVYTLTADATGNTFFSLMTVEHGTGTRTIGVLRTIGMGNRPQPL